MNTITPAEGVFIYKCDNKEMRRFPLKAMGEMGIMQSLFRGSSMAERLAVNQ